MTAPTTLDITLPSALAQRAAETPDHVFVRDVDGRLLTYAEALTETHTWAAAYRRLGVEPGEHVATMQFNTIDSMAGWVGLGWLGAIEAPINVDYRGSLLAHALTLTGARVVVLLERFVDRVLEIADQLDCLKTLVLLDANETPSGTRFETITAHEFLADLAPAVDMAPPSPWNIGAILFTSGTTGPSKAVRLPWAQIHTMATATYDLESMGPDDVIYNPGPTYHVGAKVFPFMAALIGGSHVMRPWPSSQSGDDLLEFGVTTGAPPMSWMADPEVPGDASRPLRNVLVPQKIPGIEEFKRRFGCRSWSGFGMTEAPCPIVSPGWDETRYDPIGLMSCGKVRGGYPDFEVRVVDEHDQPLGPGVVGELIVRSAVPWTMNAGYLNNPQATADAWRNGWFHTGDAFKYDDEGWFYFIDRIKDAIRRRGENISSFEVESYVMAHPAVEQCAAVAVKQRDEPGADEEVKVAVVRAPGAALTAEELVRWLIGRMPRFMIPRYAEFMDALPRTPTMKVRKVELRDNAINEATWDRVAAGIELPR